MKIHYNPSPMREVRVEEHINEEVNNYLTSKSNVFVVFSSNQIVFEGTLSECYVYTKVYRGRKGFEPPIYSKEAYNDLIKPLKR